MAENQNINKVEYDGETLIDLTSDTVTPETLKQGVVAHNAAGEKITGNMVVQELDILSTVEELQANTESGKVVDALVVKDIDSKLKDSNTTETFNFGSLNGVRGFFTSPSRADDSFIPFKNDCQLTFQDGIVIRADSRGNILKSNLFRLYSSSYGSFSVNVEQYSKVHVIVSANASLLNTFLLGTDSIDAISGDTLAYIPASTSNNRYRDVTLDVSAYDWFCIYCPYYSSGGSDSSQVVRIEKLELL